MNPTPKTPDRDRRSKGLSTPYDLALIDPDAVDIRDDTFRISTAQANQRLADSIRQVGLLNPPTLMPKQDQYIIISGFQRIEAMQRLDYREIPARIMPADTGMLACVRLAICDNLAHRELDLMEIYRCMRMLSECTRDAQSLAAEAGRLGLPGNAKYIHKLSRVGQLPDSVKMGLRQGRISLKLALALEECGRGAADLLAKLFINLKVNQNKQKEIWTHLSETARREKQTVRAVMDSLKFGQILADAEQDNQQKTDTIRSSLRRRRFPNLWQAQQKFNRNLQKCNPDASVHIQPPDFFEDTFIKLHFKFENKSEFKKRLTQLEKILAHPSFEKLFER